MSCPSITLRSCGLRRLFWQIIFVVVYVLRHLPYLKYVVFSNTGNNPIFTWIPRKVRYFACMTTVNKEQFWWTIFRVFWWLLFINPAQQISGTLLTKHFKSVIYYDMMITFDTFNNSFSPEKQSFSDHWTFSSWNIWATKVRMVESLYTNKTIL